MPTPAPDPRRWQFKARAFRQALQGTALATHADALVAAVEARGRFLVHGDLPKWRAAVAALSPLESPARFTVEDGEVQVILDEDPDRPPPATATLEQAITALIPWRKGPFRIGDVLIDTEWRSDLKWDRIAPHLSPLDGRTVLDVGCGSGYHLWRMHAAGARLALGIEPGLLFLTQFELLQHYLQNPAVLMLPLTMETLPMNMTAFDTVFSMGVLYHRHDAAAHLRELLGALAPEGELLLETLVLPGDDDTLLELEGRYAGMRNIRELPTVSRVLHWLADTGFSAPRCVSLNITSTDEQRTTPLMPHHSLADVLAPDNPALTREGHPRPHRAAFVAYRNG
ncbi:MAG: tRNA 5-methoxyuridine(34)/uridine 5-oxyacetic acid(34) synthase CmoB [Gammaproteobacteria bacterium]|nr:MAG: tRNA 5-methoxyuridine(34)/uridine 5-oxyacetic acid(34) synthase CmoB [Gammaproteobacteria bacterium]